jgi:hypothetical protein
MGVMTPRHEWTTIAIRRGSRRLRGYRGATRQTISWELIAHSTLERSRQASVRAGSIRQLVTARGDVSSFFT